MLHDFISIIILHGLLISFTHACDAPIVFDEAGLTAKTVLDPETQKYKIIIDPDTPGLVGEDGMRFLIAHECAHIELDHITEATRAMKNLTRLELSKKITRMEYEADCHAATTLTMKGDKKAIEAGLEFISIAEGYASQSGSYSSYQRIFNIKNCMTKAEKNKNDS